MKQLSEIFQNTICLLKNGAVKPSLVPVSAKEGTGVDQLLDMILLQAQMQELKADFTQDGKGYILESKLERGRGSVATLLCRHGQVNVGDYFTCGTTVGKVTAMFDSFGKSVKHADAKMPVQVVGFDDLPEAGSYFEVISKEQYIRARAACVMNVRINS